MKNGKITGWLLRIQPAGEYDRVLSVFSRERGLIRIMAKGTRSIRSRRSFHLDLLNMVRMEIEETTSGTYLREIATVHSYADLKENPEHFGNGCVIASFLLTFLPGEMPQPNLFRITKKIFDRLDGKMREARAASKANHWLLLYLLKATRDLGYLPNSIPKSRIKKTLGEVLNDTNPQFTLQARRTLGIFESFKSTRSS